MKLIIIAILMASFVVICFWMDLKQNKRNNENKNHETLRRKKDHKEIHETNNQS
jgi:hypothetical protein